MENYLKIENLNVLNVIKDFDIVINDKGIYSIVGKSSSGKTLLTKTFAGFIEYEGNINILGFSLKENIKKVRDKVGYLFEDFNDMFICETVRKEYESELKKMNLKGNEISLKIDEISSELNIKNLLDRSIVELSGGEIKLVSIGLILLKNPSMLILDEPFDMLDDKEKNNVTKILKRLGKTIPVIIFSNNLSDILFSKKIFVLNEGKLVLSGKKDEVLKCEKELKKSGLCLPIMADLSNKLSYYGLLDNIILDIDKMVNKLWK